MINCSARTGETQLIPQCISYDVKTHYSHFTLQYFHLSSNSYVFSCEMLSQSPATQNPPQALCVESWFS